jgi:hypothetical protein
MPTADLALHLMVILALAALCSAGVIAVMRAGTR